MNMIKLKKKIFHLNIYVYLSSTKQLYSLSSLLKLAGAAAGNVFLYVNVNTNIPISKATDPTEIFYSSAV